MPFRLSKIRDLISAFRGTEKTGAEKPRLVVDRAARFGLGGSVIYRPTGGLTWYHGTIENLSLTGVLFRGQKAVPDGCPVEMSFTLQEGSPWKAGSSVFCWGRTVRTVMPTTTDAHPALAVRILRYQSEGRPAPQIRFRSAA